MKKKLFLTLMQSLAALMLLYTNYLMTLAFPLNLDPRCLLTQCYCTRIYTSLQGLCAFSLKKPLGFLTRGAIKSLKVSGVTFIKQY